MCPIGHKRGHIYYIKGGTTKYVPYRAQKRAQRRAHLLNIYERERGHIYYIKEGTTKYVPYVPYRAQKRAHLF